MAMAFQGRDPKVQNDAMCLLAASRPLHSPAGLAKTCSDADEFDADKVDADEATTSTWKETNPIALNTAVMITFHRHYLSSKFGPNQAFLQFWTWRS